MKDSLRFGLLLGLFAAPAWASACEPMHGPAMGAGAESSRQADAAEAGAGSGGGAKGERAPAFGDAGSPGIEIPTACRDAAARSGDVFVYDLDTGRLLAGTDLPTPATLDATVVALGEGTLPADLGAALEATPPDRPEQRWLRISSAVDRSWLIVVFDVPLGFGVREGSEVTAQYSRVFAGFATTRVALTLRVGSALAFHFALGGSANELALPTEVSVEQGSELCEVKDSCGDWRAFALSLRAEGEDVVLKTNQQAQVGPYDVWHGRTAAQSSATSRCPDWNVADSTLALASHVPLKATKIELCDQKDDAFEAYVDGHRDCVADTDCAVIGDCGPNADFRAVRVDDIEEALRLMHDRCGGAYDGPRYFAGCEAGTCALRPNPNGCCGCPPRASD